MALSPSSIRRQDVGPHDSPPGDSPPPTSQGGTSNGAKADVARKTKEGIDHFLTKLEKEGLEIDGNIASIIDEGIARIKAEAARENINEPKDKVLVILLTITSITVGFLLGMEWQENIILKELAKMRRA
ncbi:uncharacterized protein LOC124663558 [Lolium rigidum]|uniref:uncharacterized protein LOC124663558 n=1 Tax=Lolium rigidum TaxID=89674 RepID=UPI001F5CCF77|nr:uncharacterized protein LOC124663558 [Lolium rigidum]